MTYGICYYWPGVGHCRRSFKAILTTMQWLVDDFSWGPFWAGLECMDLLFPLSWMTTLFPAVPLLSAQVLCSLSSASLVNLWNPYGRLVVPWEPFPSRGYRGARMVFDKDSVLDLSDLLTKWVKITVCFVEPRATGTAFIEDCEWHLRTQWRVLEMG